MIPHCPTAQQLRRFTIGDLSGVEFERIAAHVHECVECERTLSELDGYVDGLVSGLRSVSATDEASSLPEDVARCAAAIADSLDKTASTSVAFDAGRHYSRLLAAGTCRLGRFELLDEVGVGSFGHVFRARDTELDRIVAVKIQRAGAIASEEEARRFMREARSASPLSHPSIVALHETGRTEDGVCFLITEFVEGQTLEERMHRQRPTPAASARLVAQVATALHYAHSNGVVHRDVKPSNVLIDSTGDPHVTDFGLAKRESLEATITSDGRIMGTPAYMSPEHARGDAHTADARTDIYSLGVILYELLTGERPFQGAKRLLLLQVLEDEPRPPRQLDPTIPRDLELICLKAMAKSPARRYQSAQELAEDLGRFLSGDPIQARAAGYTERLWRWSRKYPLAAALFVGVMVGAVAGFLYLRQLNTWFVQEMALETARQYSDALDEFNALYSEVRGNFFADDDAARDKAHPPLPATLQIQVAERISRHEAGMRVEIFSPFSFRQALRPDDEFEHSTLERFEKLLADAQPERPQVLEHYEFLDIDGRAHLKFARGQLMKKSCLDCHNSDPKSPKRDWKEGDLAGVRTVTRPLDRDIARTQAGFRGASLLMMSIAVVLTACGVVLAKK